MKAAFTICSRRWRCASSSRPAVPLVPDETYYWEWSRHLAAGYFDHPPAIAWLVRAGTALVGKRRLACDSESLSRGIHCVASLRRWLAHCVAGRPRCDAGRVAHVGHADGRHRSRAGDSRCAAVGRHRSRAVGARSCVGGGADTARRVDRRGNPRVARTGWWVVVGIALGATLLSKYPAVLVPAGVALGCAVSPVLRTNSAGPARISRV